MGYREEVVSGDPPGRIKIWTEERFSIAPSVTEFGPLSLGWATPNGFSPNYFPDKALSNKQILNLLTPGTGEGTGATQTTYYLSYPNDIISPYSSKPITSRKIRNIIPISDDVNSDFYGGYLTDRHFQLSLDVVPVSKTEVTVVANRGRMNFKKKEDKTKKGPSGESIYFDFPLYYGDHGDSAATGIYTGVVHSIPYNYQSSIFRVPFQKSAIENYNIGNDEDFPEGYTKQQFLAALRFGSSTDNIIPIGNPAIDKKVPSLPAAEKDELLYVFYKNFEESELEIGLKQDYPYKDGDRDYEEYFLTLNSVDGAKYKVNKDYVVLVLGSFEFKDGVITKKDGPFNFYFDASDAAISKYGEKPIE